MCVFPPWCLCGSMFVEAAHVVFIHDTCIVCLADWNKIYMVILVYWRQSCSVEGNLLAVSCNDFLSMFQESMK